MQTTVKFFYFSPGTTRPTPTKLPRRTRVFQSASPIHEAAKHSDSAEKRYRIFNVKRRLANKRKIFDECKWQTRANKKDIDKENSCTSEIFLEPKMLDETPIENLDIEFNQKEELIKTRRKHKKIFQEKVSRPSNNNNNWINPPTFLVTVPTEPIVCEPNIVINEIPKVILHQPIHQILLEDSTKASLIVPGQQLKLFRNSLMPKLEILFENQDYPQHQRGPFSRIAVNEEFGESPYSRYNSEEASTANLNPMGKKLQKLFKKKDKNDQLTNKPIRRLSECGRSEESFHYSRKKPECIELSRRIRTIPNRTHIWENNPFDLSNSSNSPIKAVQEKEKKPSETCKLITSHANLNQNSRFYDPETETPQEPIKSVSKLPPPPEERKLLPNNDRDLNVTDHDIIHQLAEMRTIKDIENKNISRKVQVSNAVSTNVVTCEIQDVIIKSTGNVSVSKKREVKFVEMKVGSFGYFVLVILAIVLLIAQIID